MLLYLCTFILICLLSRKKILSKKKNCSEKGRNVENKFLFLFHFKGEKILRFLQHFIFNFEDEIFRFKDSKEEL